MHGEALTFDISRARIVLFGGRTDKDWLQTTWERTAHGWVEAAKTGPTPRSGHTLGYDGATHRVMLFGGMFSPPVSLLCDTWIYDGLRWTLASNEPCMTDRVRNASLVYDVAQRAMLLVEGPAIAGDRPQELRLWRWTGTSWLLAADGGPRRIGFSTATYDAARKVLVVPVLFGGPDAGTWEWNGKVWRHVQATPGTGPRQTYAMTYDTERRAIVLMGGQGSSRGPFLDDAWTWDGERWTELKIEGRKPSGRAGATLLDDPANKRLLLFGGYADGILQELWSLEGGAWRLLSGPAK